MNNEPKERNEQPTRKFPRGARPTPPEKLRQAPQYVPPEETPGDGEEEEREEEET